MNGVASHVGLHGNVLDGGPGITTLQEKLRRRFKDAGTSAGCLLVADGGGVLALVLDLDHEFILQYQY